MTIMSRNTCIASCSNKRLVFSKRPKANWFKKIKKLKKKNLHKLTFMIFIDFGYAKINKINLIQFMILSC